MSTVFNVPCPDCGRQMSVAGRGELRCPPCGRTYYARMGHLFAVDESGDVRVVPESPPDRATEGGATAATS